jgi:hypothetical protein
MLASRPLPLSYFFAAPQRQVQQVVLQTCSK